MSSKWEKSLSIHVILAFGRSKAEKRLNAYPAKARPVLVGSPLISSAKVCDLLSQDQVIWFYLNKIVISSFFSVISLNMNDGRLDIRCSTVLSRDSHLNNNEHKCVLHFSTLCTTLTAKQMFVRPEAYILLAGY